MSRRWSVRGGAGPHLPAGVVAVFRVGVTSMKDMLFPAITVVFFLLSWLYVRVCERI